LFRLERSRGRLLHGRTLHGSRQRRLARAHRQSRRLLQLFGEAL
jgi:hypothetical protein